VIEPVRFRDVLGHLPTGVTIVAAHGREGPVGMAVNSVTSVSLDPPMILVCPARTSTTWPAIREAGRFCVNVLSCHHEDLTRRFAVKADRFAGVAYESRPAGPALSDAVAWIECEHEAEHPAGDHFVVIARVTGLDVAPAGPLEPLVFFRGHYGSFVPHAHGVK
jgi:3-hydroxy-9,10-secoandrosta-1,3,5(10)-triene-9,17-dione monooxygenase reductase component